MGADIHIEVFVQFDYGNNPVQRVSPPPPWYWERGEVRFTSQLAPRWPDDRDYYVFNALAGVRGCEPVVAPRGLPAFLRYDDDANRVIWKYENIDSLMDEELGFYLGEHSFTWFTLAELQNFRWPEEPNVRWTHQFREVFIPMLEVLASRGVPPGNIIVVMGFDS